MNSFKTDLGVECGNHTDCHQLYWKRNSTKGGCGKKEEEEKSFLVELFRVFLSQVRGKLDEYAEGPEDTRDEQEKQSQRAPQWIPLKTLKTLPSAPTTLFSC